MREGIAEEYGFALFRQYSEKQAAGLIGYSYDTLKRKRLQGLVPYVDKGGDSIGYLGFHLADILLYGVQANEKSAPNATKPADSTQEIAAKAFRK